MGGGGRPVTVRQGGGDHKKNVWDPGGKGGGICVKTIWDRDFKNERHLEVGKGKMCSLRQ